MPEVDEIRLTPPRFAGEGVQCDTPGVVLLAPSLEAGIEGNVDQGLAPRNDDTAAEDTEIAATVEIGVTPRLAGDQPFTRRLGEPEYEAVRHCPPRACCHGIYCALQSFWPHVCVSHDDDLGVSRLYRRGRRERLHPRTRK